MRIGTNPFEPRRVTGLRAPWAMAFAATGAAFLGAGHRLGLASHTHKLRRLMERQLNRPPVKSQNLVIHPLESEH